MKLKVELNGTAVNPYHIFGWECNPFPQIAKMELLAAQKQLASLGGTPIPHDTAAEYIRAKLTGWSDEFVALCVTRFKPGELVKFEVEWESEER